jgi:hypothetical protein
MPARGIQVICGGKSARNKVGSGTMVGQKKVASVYKALLFKQAEKNIAAARLSAGGWACGLIIAVLFLE